MKRYLTRNLVRLAAFGAVAVGSAFAAPTMENTDKATEKYLVSPGDILQIGVWKEPDMQLDTVVRPDGGISFPLIGSLIASGKTIPSLQEDIASRLRKFIPDAVVFVGVKQLNGNKIYVVGKVNHAGEFNFAGPLNVMQALSIAGGTIKFAALDKIKVLRATSDGQVALNFNYDEVQSGENLEQNIQLHSGDVVVVP